MTKRSYGQFCGLAHALDIVGERWALLIVRDLLVSPRRFTDLHRGLPKIPTNILSARLKELEAHGVVRRRIMPRPDGSIVYELTEYGTDLEEVVMGLGRWGARTLGEQAPGDLTTVDSLIMAMRSSFQPKAARGFDVGFELRYGKIVLHARVEGGQLEAGPGPLADADLIIEGGQQVRALISREISPAEAIADGDVRLTGDPRLLDQFVEIFHIPPMPVAVD